MQSGSNPQPKYPEFHFKTVMEIPLRNILMPCKNPTCALPSYIMLFSLRSVSETMTGSVVRRTENLEYCILPCDFRIKFTQNKTKITHTHTRTRTRTHRESKKSRIRSPNSNLSLTKM